MKTAKKLICLLLFFILTMSLALPAFAEGEEEKPVNEKLTSFVNPNGRVMSVAAYGNVRQFPANSVEGIVNSIDLGIDIITVSVVKTQDDQFALLTSNDLSVQCCSPEGTTVAGLASNFTLEDLQNSFCLKTGLGGPDAKPTEYRVASLLDAITAAHGKALIMVNNGFEYAEEINRLCTEKECNETVILRGATDIEAIRSFTTKYGTSACKVAAYFNADTSEGSGKTYVEEALGAGAFIVELGASKAKSPVFKYPTLDKFKDTGRAFISTTEESLCGGREDRQAAWTDLIIKGYSIIETDYPRELANYLKEIETYRTELTTLIADAQGIERERYTKDSLAVLDDALKEALSVTSKGCIALDEIDTARYHIQESLDSLVVSTGNDKNTLSKKTIAAIVFIAIIFVVAIAFVVMRAVRNAHNKKVRMERFKRTFKSEIPVENDESLQTHISEDLESNRGIPETESGSEYPGNTYDSFNSYNGQ